MLFSGKPDDAVDKLKADHKAVEDLIKKIEDAAPAEKQRLGTKMSNMLKIHMTLEEELFYPALRKAGGEKDKLNEGIVEHDTGKVLINDLLSGKNDKDIFTAKLQVLGEDMKHHQDEEEERGGIFDQARDAEIDLEAMLADMLAREAELKAELKVDGLPVAQPTEVKLSATKR